MKVVGLRNVYVDYLLGCNGHVSATNLSEVLDNQYSHDRITRMLYSGVADDRTLYLKGKRMIKALPQSEDKKVLIFDDSIQAKPYSQVNGVIAYHFDHSVQQSVKGINFISALWDDGRASVPLSMQVVQKELRWNEKKGKEQWQNLQTKNELFKQMVRRLVRSSGVDYVLCDSWYSSKDNMNFVKTVLQTHFIMALKSNRLAATSYKEAESGIYKSLEVCMLGKCAVKLYFKEVDFAVKVVKQVFKNGDGSSGTLYLATSDLSLAKEEVLRLYQRRWRVEQYHKSLKSNCSLGKCQASSQGAQKTHFYLAVLAFLQLEKARVCRGHNHFHLIKEINIATVKYGLKVIQNQLHITLTQLNMAA